MAKRQIEKVLAAQLLEATKSVLEHVSRWMAELNGSGEPPPPGMSQVYGRARRLRDYLHRSVATYGKAVTLDLTEEDENTLVSCIVHHLGAVDLELERGRMADRAWLGDKREKLSKCAIEMATRPVERIPARDDAGQNTATVRSVIAAIAQRLAAPTEAARAALDSDYRMPSVISGASFPTVSPEPVVERAPEPGSVPVPQQPAAPPGSGVIRGAAALATELGWGTQAPRSAETPRGVHRVDTVPPAFGGASAGKTAPSPDALLEPQRIADPRLRAMAVMDLRAFDHTVAAGQYRLAMVHLASIFEGAVVDYALPRQKELGIKGPPETWRIEQVVETALGDHLTSMDRPYLLQMVAARHLVRPAIQLHSPMVVTPVSFERALAFVRRVLVELGYAGSAGGVLPMGFEAETTAVPSHDAGDLDPSWNAGGYA
jgi:hypothetical protein